VRLQLGLRLCLGLRLRQVAGRRLRQGRCVIGMDNVLGDMHPASDEDWYPVVDPVDDQLAQGNLFL
jgi:hypothetical protein